MKRSLTSIATIALIAISFFSSGALATSKAWTTTDASSIHFLTTKNVDVTEVHTLKMFEGKVSESGQAVLKLDLASIDTGIQIRDQRMLKHLFKEAATGTITMKFDESLIKDVLAGKVVTTEMDATFELLGKSSPLKITLQATQLADGQISVSSTKPVILDARKLQLEGGVKILQEIAKLASISQIVPVTFNLVLK